MRAWVWLGVSGCWVVLPGQRAEVAPPGDADTDVDADTDTDGDTDTDADSETGAGCLERGGEPDADGDLLSDAFEEACSHTDPAVADTDRDGLPDGLELGDGERVTDPLAADTDDDGLVDGVEDRDHDGEGDEGETDPTVADTDGDGLFDGVESRDGDGVRDGGETDPLRTDTDWDGLLDGDDPAPLDDGGAEVELDLSAVDEVCVPTGLLADDADVFREIGRPVADWPAVWWSIRSAEADLAFRVLDASGVELERVNGAPFGLSDRPMAASVASDGGVLVKGQDTSQEGAYEICARRVADGTAWGPLPEVPGVSYAVIPGGLTLTALPAAAGFWRLSVPNASAASTLPSLEIEGETPSGLTVRSMTGPDGAVDLVPSVGAPDPGVAVWAEAGARATIASEPGGWTVAVATDRPAVPFEDELSVDGQPVAWDLAGRVTLAGVVADGSDVDRVLLPPDFDGRSVTRARIQVLSVALGSPSPLGVAVDGQPAASETPFEIDFSGAQVEVSLTGSAGATWLLTAEVLDPPPAP